MKKTLLYLGGGITVISLVAAFAGKITFEQFGYITPVALSILYGLYQKLENKELKDERSLNLLENEYLKERKSSLEKELVKQVDVIKKLSFENDKISKELESYQLTTENLRNGFDSEKTVEEKPVKKTRSKRSK